MNPHRAFSSQPLLQRISVTIGIAAAIAGLAVPLRHPQLPTVIVAHQKFTVVTVVAGPATSAPATVTETDKPDRLQITRATPQIRAPRTISTAL